ncbi:hypothetical protein Pcinc_000035 [Petrolisthes cinctipes]|uniref:Uncharacterized protein n=1 Tax=Petrolisthes cinctipes TaxID=88211 RepID=A0AAE1GQA5_PETCI|nr:hypothetical protein Pcinc_000035 [Petrolisthes cinctipes]
MARKFAHDGAKTPFHNISRPRHPTGAGVPSSLARQIRQRSVTLALTPVAATPAAIPAPTCTMPSLTVFPPRSHVCTSSLDLSSSHHGLSLHAGWLSTATCA